MIKSNLFHYSDSYILVKGTITVPSTAAAGVTVNDTNKKVVFKIVLHLLIAHVDAQKTDIVNTYLYEEDINKFIAIL